MYGINGWAHWCLYSTEEDVSEPYVANKLKLFNILRILNCNRIRALDLDGIYLSTIDTLVEHSALIPPCEQTYALHKLIHLVDQIKQIGPAKFSNLFSFERVNCTLKRMNKNRCSSMASIAKAYAVQFKYIHIIFTLISHCKHIVFTL